MSDVDPEPANWRAHRPWLHLALGVLILLYFIRMGWLVLRRYQGFSAQAYDLGIFDQALWLISSNRVPFVTVRGLHILGDHFTPCLFPLAALYRLGLGTRGLLAFQVLVLALGAVPAFRLAMRHNSSPSTALLVSAAYLMHPALQRMNLFDFHPVALSTPAVLWALDAADSKKHRTLILASVVALSCKEEVALAILAVAGYTWACGQRRVAAIVAVIAVSWLLCALLLMKVYSGSEEQQYLQLYEHLGPNAQGILLNLALRPSIAAHHLADSNALKYLLLLWLPLGMLPLCHPRLLALSAPLYLMNVLSIRPQMRTIDFQYNALIIPFLVAGTALSVRGLCMQAAHRAAIGLLICCMTVGLTASPALNPCLGIQWQTWPGVEELLQRVPRSASVTATETLVPHMSQRTNIYLFPNPFLKWGWGANRVALREQLGAPALVLDRKTFHNRMRVSDVEFVVIAVWDTAFPLGAAQLARYARYALSCRCYGLVARTQSIVLLRRGADHESGLQMLGLSSSDAANDDRIEKKAWSVLTSR